MVAEEFVYDPVRIGHRSGASTGVPAPAAEMAAVFLDQLWPALVAADRGRAWARSSCGLSVARERTASVGRWLAEAA